MLSKIKTATIYGTEGLSVEVETDISVGIPVFNIVGLAGASIRESKERIRAALKNSNIEFPIARITSNLTPANIRKEGSHLDLPIAMGILECTGIIKNSTDSFAFIGELSLDGSIVRTDAVLPLCLAIKDFGTNKIIVPYDNKYEASLIRDVDIYPVKNIYELIKFLNGDLKIEKIEYLENDYEYDYDVDFNQIYGQDIPKRAIEVAAAGMHNILLNGPAGSGKTMLASRVPTILNKLDYDESIEVTKIYSLAGLLKDESVIIKRPFRAPHNTATIKSITGGGLVPKPGEVTLAHRGVLFMDEFPEFSRNVIESLRQPLENNVICISRQGFSMEFPAKFMLIATMNPCPCGNYGTKLDCNCSISEINRYRKKLSGPILDRIDLQVHVNRLDIKEIKCNKSLESSKSIRERVIEAQKIQKKRLDKYEKHFNSELDSSLIKKYCELNGESEELLDIAYNKFNLSARSYNKILKVSRTIADLEQCKNINKEHLMEALQYRFTE